MRILHYALALSLVLSYVQGKSKYVSVNLDAKWQSTPILLEASEYLAAEGNEKFWGFVGKVAELNPDLVMEETDEAMYHLVQKFSARFLSPMLQNFLKMFLSLRTYSPTVEMYQQMAIDVGPPEECEAFVDVHGTKTCDVDQVQSLVDNIGDRNAPLVFKFDHRYAGSREAQATVVLYAQLGTHGFKNFHAKLAEMASNKKIIYVFRHYIETPSEDRTRLSGYGVELAIKSTEYKAKDDTKVEGDQAAAEEEDDSDTDVDGFLFSKLRELHPDLKEDLRKFKLHLQESSTELQAFKVWELQDLSLQAAQKVLSADPEDALRLLRDISQNFPSVARSFVKLSVDEDVKKEIVKNAQYFENYLGMGPGESALYLNGIQLDMDVYDIFTLLDLMKSEASIMEGLFSLGFKGDDLYQFLQISVGGKQEFALDIRHSAVQFINDLEKDDKYKSWPDRAQDILRPTYPGMLRHVAKNFFNLVFIVDPTDPTSRELLKTAESFYVHSVPIRMGVVFVANPDMEVTGREDATVALANVFDYIKQEEGAPKALSFITDVYELAKSDVITADIVIQEFSAQFPDEDVEKVFGEDTEYDYVRKGGNDFVSKSGLRDFPQVLMNGKPLKKKDLSQDEFEEAVVMEMMQATPEIQQAVYQGKLHDAHNTLEWLMEKENVLPRLNSRVLSPAEKTIDLTENVAESGLIEDPETFGLLTARDMGGVVADNMKYLRRNDEESMYSVSLWVVADLQTEAGRNLAYAAVKRLKHSNEMRLGFVPNAAAVSSGKVDINKAVYVAITTLPNNLAKLFVTKLVKEENFKSLQSGGRTLQDLEVNGMDMAAYLQAYNSQSDSFLQVYQLFAERVVEFAPGDRGLITNGQVLGPIAASEEFLTEDIDLLEVYIKQHSAKNVNGVMKSLNFKGDKGSDLVMKIGGLLSSIKSSPTRKKVQYGSDSHSVVKIASDPSSPAFQIEAIIDPASADAQKLAPILMVLKQLYNLNIKLYMNSREKLSEMPLKRYYRYVLEPELTFKADGSLTTGPSAKFTELPNKSILTLGMAPPESWLVEVVKAQYDLDNLLLEEVTGGAIADFDLEYLLLEGHCYDASSGQPPRGLQFILGTNNSDVIMDTIVMANLGYFQLKANPGAWNLKLRPGRSAELYDISSHDHTDTPEGSSDVVVVMNTLKSKTIKIRVNKKSGMESQSLLEDDKESDKGIWDTISSSFSGGEKSPGESEDETLNIFSVASGHLYERLLRIMMMGVLKNTKSKVKFWFLKNYLSPQFKDFIPHYAKEYGFEYELVQYKWPRWLNQQKEKQRLIWGYKILFLDVLFPLHVKKFIFVDADQIIRADLQELYDLDLGGAPYGYTPFCDDRTEMDGFRFWKSGYWAGHLAGRKYHISALYVVDLKRFRQIAAGDRLRGQYQGLSQDPNSLSNLDQDLPNNMIHQVAIKSLPQEWLWCETWCSDENKKRAKTIDLCNNPMTKEPKLKAAMRIAPEWKNYDYEIKVFYDSIYGTNTRSQTEYEPPELSAEKKEAWRDRIEL